MAIASSYRLITAFDIERFLVQLSDSAWGVQSESKSLDRHWSTLFFPLENASSKLAAVVGCQHTVYDVAVVSNCRGRLKDPQLGTRCLALASLCPSWC